MLFFSGSGGAFGWQTCDSGNLMDFFHIETERKSICMNLPQVACGAYHSVALVRSLPAKNYNTQGAHERRERGRSPHFFVGEREELSAVDGGHYCPLGVELTEGASAGEVNMDHFLTRRFCHPVYVCVFSSHCCLDFSPLQSQTPPSRRGPRRRLHPGGRSAGSSPGSVPGSRRVTEGGKLNTKQLSITLANSVCHNLAAVAENVCDPVV